MTVIAIPAQISWEVVPDRHSKSHLDPAKVAKREAMENSPNNIKWDCIQDIIGYSFKDISLLIRAFTPSKNQQLELLGDGMVYGYAIEYLLFRHPDMSAADLSNNRYKLTKNASMATAIRNSGLMQYYNAQGNKAPADLFEAILGAISLDGDRSDIRKFVANFYIKNLNLTFTKSRTKRLERAIRVEEKRVRAAEGLLKLHLTVFPLLLTTTVPQKKKIVKVEIKDLSDKGWGKLKSFSREFFCDEYASESIKIPEKKFQQFYRHSYEDFFVTMSDHDLVFKKRFMKIRYGLCRCEISVEGIVIGIGEDKLLTRARCKAYIHAQAVFNYDKFVSFYLNPMIRQLKSLATFIKHSHVPLLTTGVTNG